MANGKQKNVIDVFVKRAHLKELPYGVMRIKRRRGGLRRPSCAIQCL